MFAIAPTTTGTNFRALDTIVVGSIATLKTLTGMRDKQQVSVASYYESATPDGGGGIFVWDSTSSATANDGTIIAPDAGGVGRWRLVSAGIVNAAQFGAVAGQSAATNTAALNAALLAVRHVRVTAGTVSANTLTMGTANTTLELLAGSEISFSSATTKGINCTAANCSIIGVGKLTSPATFDGTNSSRTYAVVWVEGDGFTARDFTLNNVPRAGIHFADATNWRVSGVTFACNFPYASYTGTNTGHVALDYNTPTAASKPNASGVVEGNRFEQCVQGVLAGPLGDVDAPVGLTIVGNTFNRCWDHGVYLTAMDGANVTGNTFHNVRKPIVLAQVSGTVVGNTLFADGTNQTNHEQGIFLRDCAGCLVSGNTIYGVGAVIQVDAVDGTSVTSNRIVGNTLTATATEASLVNAIRVGFNAETTSDNVVEGNTISGPYAGTFDGLISLQTKNASFIGQNNVVRNNTVVTSSRKPLLQVVDQNNAEVTHNKYESTYSAAGAETVEMAVFSSSTNSLFAHNTAVWRTGGTNVTARSLRVNTGCTDIRATDNRNRLTSGSLALVEHIVDTGTDTYLARNQLDATTPMAGSFTWNITTTNSTVTNANVVAGSRILVVPVDANAGVVVQTKGYYLTAGAGSFQIFTGDGTNTAAASNWRYSVE